MNDKVHLGHTARKRFGQNFLHDPVVIERIVKAIAPVCVRFHHAQDLERIVTLARAGQCDSNSGETRLGALAFAIPVGVKKHNARDDGVAWGGTHMDTKANGERGQLGHAEDNGPRTR